MLRRKGLFIVSNTHTHTLESKEKEKQHSRMQGKRSNLLNIWSQECKKKEKSSHTTQIIKQKTWLKSNGLAGQVGW